MAAEPAELYTSQIQTVSSVAQLSRPLAQLQELAKQGGIDSVGAGAGPPTVDVGPGASLQTV